LATDKTEVGQQRKQTPEVGEFVSMAHPGSWRMYECPIIAALRTFTYFQWRSNGRFSGFKEPGPPTVRGPRRTVSLVRQAVNTLQEF